MTEEILQRDAHVTVFEIDRGFAACVSNFFSDYEKQGKFALVPGDVLKTWKEEAEKKIPDRFFGNLPYNIGATIIADMIEAEVRFEKAVVTVQKEVAQRMCAKPGDKDYSSFSVLCAWAYDVKPLIDLGGGNFWPRPNVDSRAVIMTKKEVFPRCKSPEHFQKILRSLFSSRRKTVKNNLTAFYNDGNRAETILDAAGIDPQIRAEKLSLEQLLHLSDVSYSNIIEDHE